MSVVSFRALTNMLIAKQDTEMPETSCSTWQLRHLLRDCCMKLIISASQPTQPTNKLIFQDDNDQNKDFINSEFQDFYRPDFFHIFCILQDPLEPCI